MPGTWAEANELRAPGPARDAMRPPAFRHRRFPVLLAAYAFSLLPVHTMTFVLLTRLFELTGTPLAASFLWLANALPSIALGPVAGAVVDVRDRKHILFATNLVRGAALAGLALSAPLSLAHIYGLVLFNAVLNQFYAPAEMACLPCVLGLERLPRATSVLFVVQQASLFVGFSAGGGLVALLGIRGVVGACAAMAFIASALVLSLPPMRAAPGEPGALRDRLIDGYRYLTRHREVTGPFLLLLSAQGILSVIIVNIPAIAAELVLIPAAAAGAAIVAPFAAGAVAGAVQVPRLLSAGTRRRQTVETSLLVLGLCMAALVAIVPAFSGWPRIALAAALSAGFGSAIIGLLITARTMLLERVPGGLQGRIFGNFSVLVNLVSVLPVLFSGTVAHLTGIRVPLGVLGSACLAGLSWSRRISRAIKVPEKGQDPLSAARRDGRGRPPGSIELRAPVRPVGEGKIDLF